MLLAERVAHDGLADVDNFRRLIAETVDSEQLQSVEVKYQFQHAHPFTGYLRPRRILEKRLTHLVGHFLSVSSASVFPSVLISGMV